MSLMCPVTLRSVAVTPYAMPQLIPGEIGLTQIPSLKIENPRSPISDGASDNNGWMYFQSPAPVGAVSAD